MSKVRTTNHPGVLNFYCPGCEGFHVVYVKGANQGNPEISEWDFNGNFEKPTFKPSLKYTWHEPSGDKCCHSVIQDGIIGYQPDCTHDLKGQAIELPDTEQFI